MNSSLPMPFAPPDACRTPDNWLGIASDVVDRFRHGMVICDERFVILHVNQAFTSITGFGAAEVIGMTPKVLRSGKHPDAFYRAMLDRLARDGEWQGEIWNRHQSGELYLEWLHIIRLPDGTPNGARYAGLLRDITDRHAELERIRVSALRDPLTGLGNRTLIEDRGALEITRARRNGTQVAIVFVDLDRFKPINDTFGHAIGDQVLTEIGRRFATCLRAGDMLGRFGGDEFVAILPDLQDHDAILRPAHLLLDAVKAAVPAGTTECRIGASIGISFFPRDGNNIGELLSRADVAMYRAKAAGGNTIRAYDPAMDQRTVHRLSMEHHLHSAIANGELHLAFQPSVRLADQRICRAEALLRWTTRSDGCSVPPAVFIPLAEDCGLIHDLGNWVLNEACTVAARLARLHPPGLTLSVNVSPLQLLAPDFCRQVRVALDRSGASPSLLQLELTESVFVHEADHAAQVMRQLSDLGVSFALDDFGSGYSNLGYLKYLPFQTIKVDRQFVCQTPADRHNAAILRATLLLAQGLGMEVVAEGIETPAQHQHLMELGCEFGQGFLFGAPMSEAQLVDLASTLSPTAPPHIAAESPFSS